MGTRVVESQTRPPPSGRKDSTGLPGSRRIPISVVPRAPRAGGPEVQNSAGAENAVVPGGTWRSSSIPPAVCHFLPSCARAYRRRCGAAFAMEVEVKIRLADAAAHQTVAALLAPAHQVTHLQENVFFDGAAQQLSSQRMVLRLRFYNGDQRCVVTLKGKAVIIDGISRGSEVEEDIDVALARSCVADASQLLRSDCRLLQQVIREYECEKFVCLGGFRNVRNVFDWEGVKLELDETHYAFGTTYEIECETADPERFRQLLGALLDKNGISYRYSTMSKFGIFRAGKIGALD